MLLDQLPSALLGWQCQEELSQLRARLDLEDCILAGPRQVGSGSQGRRRHVDGRQGALQSISHDMVVCARSSATRASAVDFSIFRSPVRAGAY